MLSRVVLSRRAVLSLAAGAALAAAGAGSGILAYRGLRGGSKDGIEATNPSADSARGSFALRPPGLKQIPVHFALGAGDPRSATLVIVMHGDGRNAKDYRDAWAELIADRPLVVAAPEFSQSDFPGSSGYNQGGILAEDGSVRPRSSWTFAYIVAVFEQMRTRLGGRQATFDMFGHSAGAQFVHRYVELSPGPQLRRAVAANAGWYTMPDLGVAYPYGAGGAAQSLFDWPAAFAASLTVLLGDEDVLDDNLRHDPHADAQGSTRWARGQTFFDTARGHARELDLPLHWQRRTVPGVGHDYRAMSAAALDLLTS